MISMYRSLEQRSNIGKAPQISPYFRTRMLSSSGTRGLSHRRFPNSEFSASLKAKASHLEVTECSVITLMINHLDRSRCRVLTHSKPPSDSSVLLNSVKVSLPLNRWRPSVGWMTCTDSHVKLLNQTRYCSFRYSLAYMRQFILWIHKSG